MAELFDIDPVTGITTYIDHTWTKSDGLQVTLRREANVGPSLDYARKRANVVGKDTENIKKGWWQYATIPPIVMVMMRQKGINIFDRAHSKRMFAEINEHYPHLKTVNAQEGPKYTRKLFLG